MKSLILLCLIATALAGASGPAGAKQPPNPTEGQKAKLVEAFTAAKDTLNAGNWSAFIEKAAEDAGLTPPPEKDRPAMWGDLQEIAKRHNRTDITVDDFKTAMAEAAEPDTGDQAAPENTAATGKRLEEAPAPEAQQDPPQPTAKQMKIFVKDFEQAMGTLTEKTWPNWVKGEAKKFGVPMSDAMATQMWKDLDAVAQKENNGVLSVEVLQKTIAGGNEGEHTQPEAPAARRKRLELKDAPTHDQEVQFEKDFKAANPPVTADNWEAFVTAEATKFGVKMDKKKAQDLWKQLETAAKKYTGGVVQVATLQALMHEGSQPEAQEAPATATAKRTMRKRLYSDF